MGLRTKHVSIINKDSKVIWYGTRIAILVIILIILNMFRTMPHVSKIKYINVGIPTAFNGTKIVHISELNNSSINIVKKIKDLEPQVIIVSGGFDDANGNYSNSARTISALTDIAPVYVIYNETDTSGSMSGTGAIELDNNGVGIKPVEVDKTTFISNMYGSDIISEYNKGNETTISFVNDVIKQYDESLNSEIMVYGLNVDDKEMLSNGTFNIAVISNYNDINDKSKKYVNMLLASGLDKDSDYKSGWYNNNGTDIFITSGLNGEKSFLPQIQLITMYNTDVEPSTPLEKFLDKFVKKVDAKHTSDRLDIGPVNLGN